MSQKNQIAPERLDNIKKILVCQLRSNGDVLLATPALAMLARRFPNAEIHFFVSSTCAPMVEGHPAIARIWAIDRKWSWLRQAQFYLAMNREAFDLIVDFQQLPRCRWVMALSLFSPRKALRLSYTPPWYNRCLYTHWTDAKDGYAAYCKASVLAPLGIQAEILKPDIYLAADELALADALLATHNISPAHTLVTVDATHKYSARRWPAAHYANLLQKAADSNPNLRFLLLFGPGEEDCVRELWQKAARPEQIALPEKYRGLRHVAACIAKADFHLGGCSAPRHIAVATGTPSLSIISTSSAAWTFPAPEHQHISKGLPCQPCGHTECPNGDTACLTTLEPESVLPILLERLAALPGGKRREMPSAIRGSAPEPRAGK